MAQDQRRKRHRNVFAFEVKIAHRTTPKSGAELRRNRTRKCAVRCAISAFKCTRIRAHHIAFSCAQNRVQARKETCTHDTRFCILFGTKFTAGCAQKLPQFHRVQTRTKRGASGVQFPHKTAHISVSFSARKNALRKPPKVPEIKAWRKTAFHGFSVAVFPNPDSISKPLRNHAIFSIIYIMR